MKKLNPLLLLMAIFCGQAWADDIENKLYQSCIAANENKDSKVQAACTCQAKKWASGIIQSPTDPTKTMEIKKEYTDDLIANWNSDIGIKDGAHLQGKDAEKAAIAMNIGFACAKESGEFK